jgi:branched-subunit amino acid ABC-type transport system permease component
VSSHGGCATRSNLPDEILGGCWTRVSQFLPYIIIGITAGSVYGLAGTGLVLTYKTSGIFNFAHGSVAALSVFVFYFLHVQHGMPWPLAAVVCVGVLGPILGLGLELVARFTSRATHTFRIVSTIGLVLGVVAVGNIWYGNVQNPFPQFLPDSTIRMGGVDVSWA